MNLKKYFKNNKANKTIAVVIIGLILFFFYLAKVTDNEGKSVVQNKENSTLDLNGSFCAWFDLEDKNNPHGVVSEGVGGETHVSVTQQDYVISAFEDKVNGGKIRIKMFKDGKWKDLEDEKNTKGLISAGKGGNPTTVGIGNDVYAAFMEYDDNNRARVRKWDGERNIWTDLEDSEHPQGYLTEYRGHEPVLVKGSGNDLYALFSELDREEEKKEAPDGMAMKIRIMRWDGKKWQDLLANKSSEYIGAEIDGVFSEKDGKLYFVFEDRALPGHNRIRTMAISENEIRLLGSEDGILEDDFGYSPSIDMDEQGKLFLTYTKGKPGKMAVYELNEIESSNWKMISDYFNESGEVVESSVAATKDGVFVAYSEYVKNAMFWKKVSGKDEYGNELSDGWKVRVKKWKDGNWIDVADNDNKNGYITRSNGKGDPTLDVAEDRVYVSIADREFKSKTRVRFCDLNNLKILK